MQRNGCPQSRLGIVSRRIAAQQLVACIVLLLLSASGRGDEAIVREVRAVAFSLDGKLLAASTGQPKEKGTVTLWELSTRKILWTHEEKTGIPAVAFAPDGHRLAVAIYGNAAKVLDVADGKEKATLTHPKEVRAVAFSPDGKLLATACWDLSVRIWDLASGTVRVTCTGHKDRVFAVQFSPDGKLLLSADSRDGVKLWDAVSGAEKRTWNNRGISAVFTADGRWVLGGSDGTVRLWNVETDEMRVRFAHMAGVNGIAVSAEAQAMAVSTSANYVRVIPLNLREPTEKDRERIQALLTKVDDDAIDVREAACQELVQLGLLAEPELCRAMTEAKSAEVRLRTRRARQAILNQVGRLFHGHTEEVECAAFSPDGKLLASGGKDGTVRLWDVATGKESARLTVE